MLQEKWNSLPYREQKIVMLLALCFLMFLVYFALLKPLANKVQQSEEKLLAKQNEIAWAKQAAAHYKSLSGGVNRTNAQGSMLAIANSVAGKYGMQLSRTDTKVTNTLKLWFDDASFDKLIVMLEELQSQHDLAISKIDFRELSDSGMVRSSVHLVRAE